MKKRISTYILVFLLATVILTVGVSAADYKTTDYSVQINVKSDNSAYITEEILVDIDNPIRGIVRYIPLMQVIDYKDKNGEPLQKVRNRIEIEDISVSKHPFETYNKRGNRVIEIGNPDSHVSGEQIYNISYLARMYDDKIKEYDNFYYNVLPHNWETPIKKAEIVITMPKKVDGADVEVSAGKRGDGKDTDKISWKVEGNTVSITTKEELPKGTGIAIGIKLPEGYFTGELTHKWSYVMLYGIGVLGVLSVMALWFRYGRDPHHVQTVEFHPPAGMNSAEVGYVFNGVVDKEDVVSLFYHFAHKGYMNIEERGKGDFVLHRNVQVLPPDAKDYENTLFNGIFAKGEKASLSDLGEDFYGSYLTAVNEVESEFTEKRGHRVFAKKANLPRIGAFLLVVLATVGGGLLVGNIYGNPTVPLVITGIVAVITAVSMVFAVFVEDKKIAIKGKLKIGGTFFSVILLLVAVAVTFLFFWKYAETFIGAVLFTVMLLCGYFSVRFMRGRTKRGGELLRELLGFREFIKVAESDNLQMLVEENPSYFFDVFPYAEVMGLSRKWAKKFENLPVRRPDWYRDADEEVEETARIFDVWMFTSAMSKFNSNVSDNIDVLGENQ